MSDRTSHCQCQRRPALGHWPLAIGHWSFTGHWSSVIGHFRTSSVVSHFKAATLLFLALGNAQAAEEFRLLSRPLAIPERGTVPSYVLKTSERTFSFLAPPNWVTKEDPLKHELVMMDRSLTASIRFHVVMPPTNSPLARLLATDPTGDQLRAEWRQMVLRNYSGSRIVAECPCYTSSLEGVAFDLERTLASKPKISGRAAFIPLDGGWLEFDLITPRGRLEERSFAFGNLLTSFRVEPPKLAFRPLYRPPLSPPLSNSAKK